MSSAFQILSFLSWNDLGRAMLVCRQWAEVIIVIPIALIIIRQHIFTTFLRLVTAAGLSSISTWTGDTS